MTVKIVAEYVWHDALGALRSKMKNFCKNFERDVRLDDFSEWNFDGSSTGQAEGRNSDVILKPVAFFRDPFRRTWENCECFLVLCDTWNIDGVTPHPTNNRVRAMEICNLTKDFDPWFGFEQEYFVYELSDNQNEKEKPYGWVSSQMPSYKFPTQEQQEKETSSVCRNGVKPYVCGASYCGVGGDRVKVRNIMEQHMEYCLYSGVKICGMNLEVAEAQAEFQCGILSAHELGDHVWMARYILNRVCEGFKAFVVLHPKPLVDQNNVPLLFNGSGGHMNFSTNEMRSDHNKILEACNLLANKHNEHMLEYGVPEENRMRMTGHHETSSFDKFMFNLNLPSNRGQSIRLPPAGGYLEDRRPSSDADPYRIVSRILQTVCLKE
jgi:glutamine synthetase